jgi:putative peptidoglycan lipid II flippase
LGGPFVTSGRSLPGRRLGATLSLLTGLQILASLGLQAYLILRLGAGVATDAFYAGATVSQVIPFITVDTLAMVLVPLLASKSDEELTSHAWSLCLAATAIFSALAAVLFAIAPQLAALIVPGFSAEGKALTALLTRIHVLGMAGTACTAAMTSVFQVRHRFLWPPMAALASSAISMVAVFLLLDQWGIAAAAWAQVFAYSFPAVVMLAVLGRPKRLEWRWDLVREVIGRQKPLILTKAYFAASAPVDRILVSFLPAGSLVILELVSRFFGAAQRMISQGLLAPYLPQLSRLAEDRSWPAFRALYGRQSKWVLAVTTLVVVGIELSALGMLVWLSRGHHLILGNLTADNVRQLAWLSVFVAGALPCSVLANGYANAYYAQGDTSTPSRIGATTFTAGLLLRAVGFWLGGIEGIALAGTLVAGAAAAWLWHGLNARTARLMREDDAVVGAPLTSLHEANQT